MLDADWNEQQDITATRVETGTLDLIGRCGGPANGKGFEIQVQGGGRIAIGKGHYYVDGILCENDAGVGPNPNFIWLSEQPDLQPNPYVLKPDTTPFVRAGTPSPGFYLAFLDVWQRHITALEDPEIREKALGGPDTATRNRTV